MLPFCTVGSLCCCKMVNGLHLHSTFNCTSRHTQSILNFASHSPIHSLTHSPTNTNTDGDGAGMRGPGLSIKSNLGFSILLKDTLTHGLEESGIEPPTWQQSSLCLQYFHNLRIRLVLPSGFCDSTPWQSVPHLWLHLEATLSTNDIVDSSGAPALCPGARASVAITSLPFSPSSRHLITASRRATVSSSRHIRPEASI